MFYTAIAYLKFLWKATNQHGVHSPFVYGLISKCFYDTKKYSVYATFDAYRKKLLQSNSVIEVAAFGAGSRIFKTNKREIKKMAMHAGISKKRQRILFRVAAYLNTTSSLELGTSLGLGTIALASAENNSVITVEGCKNTATTTQNMLKDFAFSNVDIVISDFKSAIKLLPQNPFDLIFIDGDHTKESTLAYFTLVLPYTHNNTLVIFDDIYWSKEMTQAWKEIIAHPKVSVSIDTFKWGMIFFRKEQKKESFSIRM